MIVLFTDFGVSGPYVGQMTAVLRREAQGVDVIGLFHDAPAHDPQASAYLLPAYVDEFAPGSVFLCVVDPGVGGARTPVVLTVNGRWFVGPANGLFELVARRASGEPRWWEIVWRPQRLSASFHGRDLFAPMAARLARGLTPEPWGREDPSVANRRLDWPDDLARVIYIDGFGNAMTGLRAGAVPREAVLRASGHVFPRARTFSDVPLGSAFWYENSNGLVEIAVNQGRADAVLGLRVGNSVTLEEV